VHAHCNPASTTGNSTILACSGRAGSHSSDRHTPQLILNSTLSLSPRDGRKTLRIWGDRRFGGVARDIRFVAQDWCCVRNHAAAHKLALTATWVGGPRVPGGPVQFSRGDYGGVRARPPHPAKAPRGVLAGRCTTRNPESRGQATRTATAATGPRARQPQHFRRVARMAKLRWPMPPKRSMAQTFIQRGRSANSLMGQLSPNRRVLQSCPP